MKLVMSLCVCLSLLT